MKYSKESRGKESRGKVHRFAELVAVAFLTAFLVRMTSPSYATTCDKVQPKVDLSMFESSSIRGQNPAHHATAPDIALDTVWAYPRKYFVNYKSPKLSHYKAPIFREENANKMHRYAIHAAALEILQKHSDTLYAWESGVDYRDSEGLSTCTIAEYVEWFKKSKNHNAGLFSVDLSGESIRKAKIFMEQRHIDSSKVTFYEGYSTTASSIVAKKFPCINYASIDAGGDPWHAFIEFERILPQLCENFIVNVDDCNVSPPTKDVFPRVHGKASIIYPMLQLAEIAFLRKREGGNASPLLKRIRAVKGLKKIVEKGAWYYFSKPGTKVSLGNLIFASAPLLNELDGYFNPVDGYWNNYGGQRWQDVNPHWVKNHEGHPGGAK